MSHGVCKNNTWNANKINVSTYHIWGFIWYKKSKYLLDKILFHWLVPSKNHDMSDQHYMYSRLNTLGKLVIVNGRYIGRSNCLLLLLSALIAWFVWDYTEHCSTRIWSLKETLCFEHMKTYTIRVGLNENLFPVSSSCRLWIFHL